MATKTTKKTVAVKKTAEKKITSKKVERKEKAEALPENVKAVAKAEAVKAEPTKAEVKKKVQTERTEFGATPLSHTLFVLMTVILWAFLTAWVVIDLNYDVKIEHKDVVARRIERRMERLAKERAKKQAIKKTHHYTVLDKKTGKRVAVVTPVGDKTVRRAAKKAVKPAQPIKKETAPKPVVKKVARPPLKLAERKATFVEAEYAPYAGTGKAVIEGQACFELADGNKKCFEDANVFINPVTTYSDEWYNRGWAGKEFLEKADARALPYNKMIKTGKDGYFKFEGLQPGSYYVGAMVCLPEAQDSKKCSCSRFASKVTMKNRVKTTLKQVYPVK